MLQLAITNTMETNEKTESFSKETGSVSKEQENIKKRSK